MVAHDKKDMGAQFSKSKKNASSTFQVDLRAG
jgi:hypothetical protein